MIEWEPNKNDANLNMPVDGQVASICWNEQTKLLTMSLAYSAVYGMGERYNGLNQNDRIVKIEVEEKFCNQGDKSYCPSPFFFTDTGFSFCTLSGGTLIFDFTQKNVITVHAPGNCKFIFNAGTPAKLISEYMSLSGPAILPPDWVFGPWISANHWNTQKETEKQIELLKKYQFPATVLVLGIRLLSVMQRLRRTPYSPTPTQEDLLPAAVAAAATSPPLPFRMMYRPA